MTTTDPAAAPDPVELLLDELGVDQDRDLVREIVRTGAALGIDDTARLDLKITASAIAEMREAFRTFAPYRDRPKVTIFGSARTRADDPLYRQTHDVAAALAAAGWMVVTGAGPGIMQAAMEGAGREASMGVSIRLPFEERPNDVIHDDPKHVSMKYFFTRKLMLVKESRGFIAMPGGFGTLDETLELLTLQQTGKSEPTPIVLLDIPGGTYWGHFARFVDDELARRGLVAADDLERVCITDSVERAVLEIEGFWRNYHSLRWIGQRLILRLRAQPTAEEVEALNVQFGSHLTEGRIEAVEAHAAEIRSDDHVALPRLAMVLDPYKVGGLHQLIRAVNGLASAPL